MHQLGKNLFCCVWCCFFLGSRTISAAFCFQSGQTPRVKMEAFSKAPVFSRCLERGLFTYPWTANFPGHLAYFAVICVCIRTKIWLLGNLPYLLEAHQHGPSLPTSDSCWISAAIMKISLSALGLFGLGLVRHLAWEGRRRLCTVSHHELVFLFKKNPKLQNKCSWRASDWKYGKSSSRTHALVRIHSGTFREYDRIQCKCHSFCESLSSWLHDGWTGLSFLGAKCFSLNVSPEATGLVQTASLQRHPHPGIETTGHPTPQNQMRRLSQDSWHLTSQGQIC